MGDAGDVHGPGEQLLQFLPIPPLVDVEFPWLGVGKSRIRDSDNVSHAILHWKVTFISNTGTNLFQSALRKQ